MPRTRRPSAGLVDVARSSPGSTASEAALEAWVACGAKGYTLDERRISDLLPRVVSHLLNQAPEACMEEMREIFITESIDEPPLFLRLVRAREGVVHFLYFWKAFSEVALAAGALPSEGLTAELDTLRDEVLRRLEEASRCRKPQASEAARGDRDAGDNALSFQAKVLVEELHRAAVMSEHPHFWQRVAMPLSQHPDTEVLGIEDLTHILLVWMHEALVWEHNAKAALESGIGDTTQRHAEGMPVRLHIYDVSQHPSIQTLNRFLAFELSPVKFGGVFHAGVEVNGLEWSFNFSPSRSRPGICCMKPKKHPNHHFRETVDCGYTKLEAAEISGIIAEMLEDYPGQDYNLLRRNCCHFADDFLQRMGLEGIPGWVHRLAHVGANVETALQTAQAVRDAVSGGCGCVSGGCGYEELQGKRPRRLSRRQQAPTMTIEHSTYPDPQADSDPELGIFGKLAEPDLGIFGKPSFISAAVQPPLARTEQRATQSQPRYKMHM